jgi:hypothetical protein
MIEILPFSNDHYSQLSPRFEELSAGYRSAETRRVMLQTAARGEAFTALQDGKVVAFGGYYHAHPGCVEVWMQASDEIYSCPRAHARKVYRALQNILTHCKDAWRFQTTSYPDAKHTQWMEWLGFTCEGRLRKITQAGGDLTIWSIVR